MMKPSKVGPVCARRAIGVCSQAGCIAFVAGLAACSNPLGPIEADYGQRTAEDRLRRIDVLDRDKYTRPAGTETSVPSTGPSTGPSSGPSSGPAAKPHVSTRVKNPFEGMDRVPMTLEEARSAAFTNNLDLKVSLIDPTISSEQLKVEEGKYDAVFRPSVSYQDVNNPTLNTTSANSQKNTRFGTGIDVPLRTGGRASVDMFATRQNTANPFFTINSSYSTAATFSLSQPLLRNAGRRASTYSIRIAEFDRRVSEARTKLEVIRQLANVDRSYWRLYAATKLLEVRQRQYELAEAQLERARRRAAAGDVAAVEVVRAEAGLASRIEGIIVAANEVAGQVRELKRIINIPGLELQTPTVLTTGTEPEVVPLEFDDEALMTLGVENRMEMLELELKLAQDFSSVEYAKNQTLPLITLDYQYNIPGLGSSLQSSFDQLRGLGFAAWEVQLSGQIPLGNDQAKARLQTAILQRLQRLATKDARRQAIQSEVLQATSSANTAWQRILAARQNVIAAARTLEAEQRQFEAGSRTSTDVLDAASRVAEAQNSEISAIADYQISQVDLAFATGTLLGAGKVDWSPSDPRAGVSPAFRGQYPGDPTPPIFPIYDDPDNRSKPAPRPAPNETDPG